MKRLVGLALFSQVFLIRSAPRSLQESERFTLRADSAGSGCHFHGRDISGILDWPCSNWRCWNDSAFDVCDWIGCSFWRRKPIASNPRDLSADSDSARLITLPSVSSHSATEFIMRPCPVRPCSSHGAESHLILYRILSALNLFGILAGGELSCSERFVWATSHRSRESNGRFAMSRVWASSGASWSAILLIESRGRDCRICDLHDPLASLIPSVGWCCSVGLVFEVVARLFTSSPSLHRFHACFLISGEL